MKKFIVVSAFAMAIGLFSACSHDLDPLSPSSMNGQYALGIKGLVPFAVGNTWNYNVVLYDTTGAEKTRYSYALNVLDTVKADTNRIPIVAPNTNRIYLNKDPNSLKWYRLQGEMGRITHWQVDGLENLRIRKSDDTLYFQQMVFDYRASVGARTGTSYVDADTLVWWSGDVVVTNPDSVKSQLVAMADTLRTTLGSAPYYKYWQSFSLRTDSITYYFKPGFGLVLYEKFQRRSDGTMVCVRRDELNSYYFR
jgi:hypothetical protein